MQRAADAFNEFEVHLREVVIQHARGDARLIHLKREHDQVEHQLHVIWHILRNFIGWAWHVRLLQRGPPALQPLFLRRPVDALFDIPYGFQILVQLLLVAAGNPALQCRGIGQHGVENTLVERPALAIANQLIKGAGGINFLWRGLGRRDPRDVRPIQHRQAVFQPQLVRFNAQRHACNGGAAAQLTRQHLVKRGAHFDDTGVGADRRARKHIRHAPHVRARIDECLVIIQAVDEDQILADRHQRRDGGTQFHGRRPRPSASSWRGRRRSKNTGRQSAPAGPRSRRRPG